ncbi:cell division protein FtsQ/DivIB [bacterium]|nr:cell division protein FtsQ/DivIB [bacterium]
MGKKRRKEVTKETKPKSKRKKRIGRIFLLFLSLIVFTFAGFGVHKYLTTSPGFSLKEPEILGLDLEKRKELASCFDRYLILKYGTFHANIFDVRLASLRSYLLQSLPEIRQITLIKRFPDKILIKASLRKPLAVVGDINGFAGLDEEGVLFRTARQDLPLIYGLKAKEEDIGRSFFGQEGVLKSLNLLKEAKVNGLKISQIKIKEDELLLTIDGTQAVFKKTKENPLRLKELSRLLNYLKESQADTPCIDMRFEDIVVKPQN